MPKYYTPKEVAEELRVSERSVYDWLTTGRLGAVRAGKYWRIRREDIEAFMQQGANSPAAAPARPAAERRRRVLAGYGAFAGSGASVDALLEMKREDTVRENAKIDRLSGVGKAPAE
jgi:excisionase family DNA binding protein